MASKNFIFIDKENTPVQQRNIKPIESLRKKLFDLKNTTEDNVKSEKTEKVEKLQCAPISTPEMNYDFDGIFYGNCDHCHKKEAEKFMISDEIIDSWIKAGLPKVDQTPVKLDLPKISFSDLMPPEPEIELCPESPILSITYEEMKLALEAEFPEADPNDSFF